MSPEAAKKAARQLRKIARYQSGFADDIRYGARAIEYLIAERARSMRPEEARE